MSYSSGTANDASALRAAIFAAAAADGWALDSPVLSKGSLAMKIDLSTVSGAAGLMFTGGTGHAGAALVGACPYHVSLGDRTNLAMTWPVTYRIFSFSDPDEIYVVVAHDTDRFQFAAWGKSTMVLPGTGMWFGATIGHASPSPSATVALVTDGTIGPGGQYAFVNPALMFRNMASALGSAGSAEAFMHHGLDGDNWTANGAAAPGPSAADSANPMLAMLPNAWNSEAVLLPIMAVVARASNMVSPVVSLANARYLRIDNYAPGELITLGADRWMVLPWLRKDASARDGTPYGGLVANPHSGTLGWALRYEGA